MEVLPPIFFNFNVRTWSPGWSSFMIPSLATFFKQTTSARSLNYHYKRNILANNIWFGLIFAGLAIFLNEGLDSSGVNPCIDDRLSLNDSKTELMSADSGNPLKRNHLFTCYDNQVPTYDELSLSHLPCKEWVDQIHSKSSSKYLDVPQNAWKYIKVPQWLNHNLIACSRGSSGYIHKDTFLGQSWWVMLPCEPEKGFSYNKAQNHPLELVCNTTELEVNITDFDNQDRHLIAKDCEKGEGSIQKY